MTDTPRPGEQQLPFDPGADSDATLAYIGVLRSDWRKGGAPRNLGQARERGGGGARVELKPGYADGLRGLEVGRTIWLLLWFDRARRDLIVQAPAHAEGPRGTFALRSPVRPNPVAMELVRITSLDAARGVIGIDATDAFDQTPVLDIKPWIAAIDSPPEEGAAPES